MMRRRVYLIAEQIFWKYVFGIEKAIIGKNTCILAKTVYNFSAKTEGWQSGRMRRS